jgi:hypothetical protein
VEDDVELVDVVVDGNEVDVVVTVEVEGEVVTDDAEVAAVSGATVLETEVTEVLVWLKAT